MKKYHILELITFIAIATVFSKSIKCSDKVVYAQQNKVEEQIIVEDSEHTDIELAKPEYNTSDEVHGTVEKVNNDMIFIGDSRTVGMKQSGVINPKYDVIAKVGEGYNYLNDNIYKVNDIKNTNIVINLGINDLSNIDKYLEKYKELSNNTDKSNKIYLVSINPIEYHETISSSDIEEFNDKIKKLCNTRDNIEYIDTYNNIEWNEGFTQDGIHYTNEYYIKIYNYIYESIYG